MRIFIGIKCPEKLKKDFLNWQEKNQHLSVRFVKPENLHITLISPWYVKDRKEVIEKLKEFKGKSFEISFSEILYFPPSSYRMIWARGETPHKLLLLQKNLLKHFEKQKEKRPFDLHITLARFRPENKLAKIKNKKIKWIMNVDEIVLFQSKLSPHGANYEVLYSISLRN